MENKTNTWFYNDGDNEIKNKFTQKTKFDYIRFIIRLDIKDIERMKAIEGFENFKTDTKDSSPANVEEREI